MLGFMDLGWPRVCRRSTSVLFYFFGGGSFYSIFGCLVSRVSLVRAFFQ